MTIKEIKDLTKFLTDQEIEQIKEEIKSKEATLKAEKMEEEELTQVLNTLFSILVIEKTLENEIDGVEEIRDKLEKELLESYEVYDSHLATFKKGEKKKKKRWLLDFLFISDRVSGHKKKINSTDKTISRLTKELEAIKQQTREDNLREIVKNTKGPSFEKFCEVPKKCRHPYHSRQLGSPLRQIRNQVRMNRLVDNIRNGRITGPNANRIREQVSNNNIRKIEINLNSSVLNHKENVSNRGQDTRGANIGSERKR